MFCGIHTQWLKATRAMEYTFDNLIDALKAPRHPRLGVFALRLAEGIATGLAIGVGIAVGRVLAG